MYKLVMLDLDGTLLNEKKEIMPKTKNVLKNLSKKGVKVVISTGRAFYRTEKYVDELELLKEKEYTVLYNGAVIIENSTKQVIFSRKFDNSEISELVLLANRLNVVISLYTMNYVITNQLLDRGENNNIKVIEELDKEDYKYEKIYKVVFIINKNIKNYIVENVFEKLLEKYEITSSTPEYIEFTKHGVSKASALEFLCNVLSINKSEVIAIGDSSNDKKMIEVAGIGVAMGMLKKN